MRKPILRAWDYFHNKMLYGDEFDINNHHDGITADIFTFTDDNTVHPIMQYTGLTDKNGVKIFEGDIISSPHFTDAAGKNHTLNHIVEWSDRFSGWFLLNCKSKDPNDGSLQLFVSRSGKIEVVGNVYENNELIE